MLPTMRIFLSGPMGSGKSTVGRLVAARLGAPFVDLDAAIERRHGQTVRAMFDAAGEAAFRDAEAQVLGDVLGAAGALVVALGGGTVVRSESRRRLLADGIVVTLTADAAELARRVAGEGTRPLLAGRDPAEALMEVLAARRPAYAECHGDVPTAGRAPDAIAADVIAIAEDAPVVVALGERSYGVFVGAGVRHRAAKHMAGASSVVVVCDAGTKAPWGEEALAALGAQNAQLVTLPAGEAHKDVRSVERIWDAALSGGVDRNAFVLAVGGGVVGDLAGFAASTLLRGVRFGQVPTTVLAMVDSSVGGKTGFDRVQGKNLVGSFHQPRFVLADVETLRTLPVAERVAGLAEVVKSAWLAGEEAVALVERDAAALAAGDTDAMGRAIRMAVTLKARIVAADETESGPRMLLNLGHTVGHALEAASGYTLRHGEAVSLGMVAAFQVAASLGGAGVGTHAARLTALLARLGLPTDLAAARRPGDLAFLGSDKKRGGGALKFIVPGAPGSTEIVPVSPEQVAKALGA